MMKYMYSIPTALTRQPGEEVSCGAEGACEASNDIFRKQEIYASCHSEVQDVAEGLGECRTVIKPVQDISDATRRQSMISEATSEGTITCTSPRASIYGKGIGLHCANCIIRGTLSGT